MVRHEWGKSAEPQSSAGARRQPVTAAAAALALACLLQLSACTHASAQSSNSTATSSPGKSPVPQRCGHQHDDAEYAAARQSIASVQRMGALNPNARVAFSNSVTIPVWFHVITQADGTGNVTMSQIQQQMNVTNSGFSPQFTFYLQGVEFIINDQWFNNAA